MNFRKMIRWQLVLAGLAATMLVSPSARSQEFTNTTFDDGPNVATFTQSTAAQPSAQEVPVATAVPTLSEVASIQTSLTPSQGALMDSPWATAGLTILLLTGVALSAIGESKRKRGSYGVRRYPSYRRA